MSAKKSEFRRKAFASAMDVGVKKAGKFILKISSKSAEQVKDGPVGELAVNVDNTLKVFINEDGDGTYIRFKVLAARIVDLITEARVKEFTSITELKKIQKLGEAFGFMAGTAVMTAMSKVFTHQAYERIAAREDIPAEGKKLLNSYVNDAFSIALMALAAELDRTYPLPKRERRLFATVLTANEWLVDGKSAENQEQQTEPLV